MAEFVTSTRSALQLLATAVRSRSRLMAAPPTTGTAVRGDIVWNSVPTATGNVGWVCVTAGSPGTWRAFGAEAAGGSATLPDVDFLTDYNNETGEPNPASPPDYLVAYNTAKG